VKKQKLQIYVNEVGNAFEAKSSEVLEKII